MPNVIAAPHNGVVAYLDKGLNGIVFENKTVFANPPIVEDGSV